MLHTSPLEPGHSTRSLVSSTFPTRYTQPNPPTERSSDISQLSVCALIGPAPQLGDWRLLRELNPSHVMSEDPFSLRLVQYYDHVVAPQMVWIDSSENPFRHVVIPLAIQTPVLMTSILTLASGDLRVRSHGIYASEFAVSSRLESYQEETLVRLARHLKDATEAPATTQTVADISPTAGNVLATFLMIYLSVKLGDVSNYRLHTRAAWSLIENWRLSLPLRVQPSMQGLRDFLLHEAYLFKVCVALSTFQPFDDPYEAASMINEDQPFMRYLKIILDLVEIEQSKRSRSHSRSHQRNFWLDLSVVALRKEFDAARERSLKHKFRVPVPPRIFEHLVDLFHYSGIYFGSQVLSHDQQSASFATSAHRSLLSLLRQVPDIKLVAQNLGWPVFFAGTGCHGSPDDISFVRIQLQEVIRLTGWSERRRLLRFLEEFWTLSDGGTPPSWIDLAQSYAFRGEPILIF
ncbi:hypothetical protein PV08_02790 [Exophiala spinifera]|uniref:C6 zinc finger domain-containing protein n=1 Tax=Exophiala spinifera TaxID=91928 RepID=A0A0D2A0N3_9EURO|nr:uncharacterized protein PV08_02790 [Exophiala spinifera]KIW18502.1 hypothetical protein PV08_02790 [Exophiala spinifera]